MKVPYTWLREYCDPGAEPRALAERLAMTGTEVERVVAVGPSSADGFVVGRVLEREKHPDADRLSVCSVDTGDAEPRTIVCGAPNVDAGQTVAVALPGATMPGGMEIREAKLRGVRSRGMILSAAELELEAESDGILVLNDRSAVPFRGNVGERNSGTLEPGTPLSEVVPVAEPVLELEVTPNRPDCLGVYGVAREVHAISGAPLAPPPWEQDAPAEGKGEVGDYASVRVDVPELCPRFTARVFTDVTIGPSPLWLQARLAAAGQRPINNVVDITNYVMLLTAQPLHAFDLDRLPGGALFVMTADDGEEMNTLDGVERTLDSAAAVVCDYDGIVGIAGIMGGEGTDVTAETTRVLLEVANWDGPNILRTSRLLGLRSEASARFEKGLHPALCMRAQQLASRLLVELCGAKLVPGTIDVAAERAAESTLRLRAARVEGLLGMAIPHADQVDYLQRLGFAVEPEGEDLLVTVPPDRAGDVTREVDLIEEVARIHGLDENLPSTLPANAAQAGGLSRPQRLRRRAEDAMRDLGFDEIVGWSFTDPGEAGRLRIPADDPRSGAVVVSNPLSEEQSAMRTTLLGSLLDAAQRNLARDAERVALFESARVYLAGDSEFLGERGAPFAEPQRLAALASGALAPATWRGDAEAADFFALKGVLEGLAARLGVGLDFAQAGGADGASPGEPFLHPGRAARVEVGGEPIGWLGEVHPLVCRAWDIDAAAGFELDLAPLLAAAGAGEERFEDVTTYPAVRQDLAVVVPDDVAAAELHGAVLAGGGELLRRAEVFDLYAGEQLDAGRKSLALRLEFRAADRTLTDEEVAARRAEIVAAVEKIGGSIRE